MKPHGARRRAIPFGIALFVLAVRDLKPTAPLGCSVGSTVSHKVITFDHSLALGFFIISTASEDCHGPVRRVDAKAARNPKRRKRIKRGVDVGRPAINGWSATKSLGKEHC
jgi:hypothetical protein